MPAPLRTRDLIEATPVARVSAHVNSHSAAHRLSSPPRVGARAACAPVGAGNLSTVGAHMLALMTFLGNALLAAFATEYESIRELADRP